VRREIRWSEWDDPGLGHLRLLLHNDGVVADGMVIGVAEGRPFRAAYEVRCDIGWRVRVVRVGAPVSELPAVDQLSDGGNWTMYDGRLVPELEGCMDVDISVTPFTNTLPIQKLGLAPTESPEVSVAYVEGTELQSWPESQRYTCLEPSNRDALYRFRSLDGGGFTADLPGDANGLVPDYLEMLRRAFQDEGDPEY